MVFNYLRLIVLFIMNIYFFYRVFLSSIIIFSGYYFSFSGWDYFYVLQVVVMLDGRDY